LELLRNVKGLDFKPAAGRTTCCGFGGTFSVKYPYISEAMLDDKLQEIEETSANAVVSCDMGCLMHIGGGLSRKGSPIRAMHLAELLTSQQNEE
jgi:L-lactate dehydrogenase complex protein LldE